MVLCGNLVGSRGDSGVDNKRGWTDDGGRFELRREPMLKGEWEGEATSSADVAYNSGRGLRLHHALKTTRCFKLTILMENGVMLATEEVLAEAGLCL